MTFQEFKTIHEFLSSQIKGSEFEDCSFYVGGCVRDVILDRPIKDIDICVAKPNGGIEFAEFLTKKLGIYEEGKNPIIFPQFGTAKFRLKSALPNFGTVEIECVQTRKEAYRDSESRKPETCFGTIKEDALRRDLTINAFYCKISDAITYDVTTLGNEDIVNKKLRTPSDPDIAFKDDALRILRVIRFSATLGWGIESKTWLGMCKNAHRLVTISKERIQEEFNKIITAPYASEGIRKLYWCGAMKYFIPEFELLKGLTQGKFHNEDAFDHSLTVMEKMQPNVINRLAGLFHDIAKPSTKTHGYTGIVHFTRHETEGALLLEDILGDLKYSSATIKAVVSAVKNHMRFKQTTVPSTHAIRKFANEVPENYIDLCLELIDADNNSHAPKYCLPNQVDKIRKRLEKLSETETTLKVKLPIDGKDIMHTFNIKKGPRIGAALRLLTEYYYISPKMSKEEALKVIERAIAKNEI